MVALWITCNSLQIAFLSVYGIEQGSLWLYSIPAGTVTTTWEMRTAGGQWKRNGSRGFPCVPAAWYSSHVERSGCRAQIQLVNGAWSAMAVDCVEDSATKRAWAVGVTHSPSCYCSETDCSVYSNDHEQFHPLTLVLIRTTNHLWDPLKVDRELLDRVKSLKLGFYGHHDTEIRKSGEGNRSRMCTRLQKSWSTTPALDKWYRWMDWDEDPWSGYSSGRSWSLGGYYTRRQPFLWRKALNNDDFYGEDGKKGGGWLGEGVRCWGGVRWGVGVGRGSEWEGLRGLGMERGWDSGIGPSCFQMWLHLRSSCTV